VGSLAVNDAQARFVFRISIGRSHGCNTFVDLMQGNPRPGGCASPLALLEAMLSRECITPEAADAMARRLVLVEWVTAEDLLRECSACGVTASQRATLRTLLGMSGV